MKKIILLLICFQCVLCHISFAQQAGSYDYTFGPGSTVQMLGMPWFDIAVQSDGKVLTVSNIIARYTANGTLDGSFGNGGIVDIVVNDTFYACRAIGIQSDGKIIAAGEGNDDLLLVRYNSDGSPDSSFDGDGALFTDIGLGSSDYGYKLAIQQDGKIIVAGEVDGTLALVRYHSDGSLDSSFDNDGKLIIGGVNIIYNNWEGFHPIPAFVELQTDGKILAGSADRLVRVNVDGSMDYGFGTVFLPVSMNDLAIQPDGKIVLAGGGHCFAIVRLDSNGSVDGSFGNSGIATKCEPSCCNTDQTATSIALQSDGRILAGGSSMYGMLNDYRDFILVRYDPDGGVDNSFGSDGQVVTSFLQLSSESYASVITPDMGIILAGSTFFPADRGLLVKYHLGWIGWPLDVNTISGNNENFVISPNPTFDQINIEASKIENGSWHLELRDVTGRSVLQEDIVTTGGSIQKKVSLNDLPAGLYLLQLDNGKQKMMSRIVKFGN